MWFKDSKDDPDDESLDDVLEKGLTDSCSYLVHNVLSGDYPICLYIMLYSNDGWVSTDTTTNLGTLGRCGYGRDLSDILISWPEYG